MDQATFVDLLRQVVIEPAASDTLSQIANPAGRNLSEDRKKLAAWFASLAQADRDNVRYAVVEAARATAFGVCCVLDGSRAIEDQPHRGYLELRHIFGDTSTLLASSAIEMPAAPLHELL